MINLIRILLLAINKSLINHLEWIGVKCYGLSSDHCDLECDTFKQKSKKE
jgi:hypothetical protein